jgi:Tol biopolymer transport system component
MPLHSLMTMRTLPYRLLPLILLPLWGCGGSGEWWPRPVFAGEAATPLANDTTVVTTRRVWTSAQYSKPLPFDLNAAMPDGAGMAAVDWMKRDVAIFDFASGTLRPMGISGEGVPLNPLPSPDGRHIAYTWLDHQPSLRLVDVVSGERRTLIMTDSAGGAQSFPVAWTPAGDSVFVVEWARAAGMKLLLAPVSGGTPRLVHSIPDGSGGDLRFSLSPDGRWLLYEHEDPRAQTPHADIHRINVQGGGASPLMEHAADERLVGWLPGTDVLLFTSDRSGTTDLWSVRVANGRVVGQPQLVRSGFLRTWPAGFGGGALFFRVATGSAGQSIVSVDPSSGALRGEASPPVESLTAVHRTLAWSPDGHTIAAPTAARGNVGTITLHSMQTGVSRKFVLEHGIHPLLVSWAPDGNALYVRSGETGRGVPTGRHRFLRLDVVTGATTPLFDAPDGEESPPLWQFLVTRDGRSLLLRQQHSDGNGEKGTRIVLRSLADGSDREVYRTTGFIPEFALSDDGTKLAFMQQRWQRADSLFVMRLDGSQPPQFVATWAPDQVTLLGWLPGGNTMLAARLTEDASAEEILRIGMNGTITDVGRSPFIPQRGQKVQGYYRSRLTLSPAGNRLLHWVSDAGSELWRMDGLPELFANRGSDR